MRVHLDPVPDGVYTVTWRTVSATDGHVTAGAFSFGVGVSPGDVTPVEQTGSGTPTPTAGAIAGRWMLYVGLVVLFGAAVTGLLAFGPKANARPWLLGAAWALAALGVVAMTLAERSSVGVPLGTLLSSEAGGKFVLLAVAVAVAGVAALAACCSGPGARPWWRSPSRRPARCSRGRRAATPPAPRSTVATQWLHFLGVGAWIGGLVWLVVGLVRRLEPAQVRRYSRLAGVGLVVVVVSGVLRSTNELGWGWLLHPFRSDYSTTLVVKLAIVAALIALGAVNRYRNVARFEQGGPRPVLRTAGGELALAVCVFAATALLTGLPPQPNAEAPHAPRPLVVRGSDFATTTRVELRITPGTVGPNTFVASVTDYDTGQPVDARRVSMTFELAGQPNVTSTLELERVTTKPVTTTRGRPRAPRSHSKGPGRLRCWWRGRAVPSRSRSRSHRNRPTSTSTSRACPASRTCTRSRSRAACRSSPTSTPASPAGRTRCT